MQMVNPLHDPLSITVFQLSNYVACRESYGLLQRAHIIAGELRFIGTETDLPYSVVLNSKMLISSPSSHLRSAKVIANGEIQNKITEIGINKCARESGFDRKNFIRKLIREIPVKRNSYEEFVRWLQNYNSTPSL